MIKLGLEASKIAFVCWIGVEKILSRSFMCEVIAFLLAIVVSPPDSIAISFWDFAPPFVPAKRQHRQESWFAHFKHILLLFFGLYCLENRFLTNE